MSNYVKKGALVDRYAILVQGKAELEREIKNLRAQILDRFDGDEQGGLVQGDQHLLKIIHASTARLSTALAKAELTPAQILACTVIGESVTIYVES